MAISKKWRFRLDLEVAREIVPHPENGFTCAPTQCHARGADDAGHHHRRRGGDRDDGDRQRLVHCHPAHDRQHGRQHRRGDARRCCQRSASRTGRAAMMTLTPQDADAILKECPAVGCVAPVVRARTQVVYGNRNWVPTYIYGTTPSFLAGARLDRYGRGRSVHRARRPQRQQGVRGRPDDRERAVWRAVARRQGDPHPECRLQGHRRAADERART